MQPDDEERGGAFGARVSAQPGLCVTFHRGAEMQGPRPEKPHPASDPAAIARGEPRARSSPFTPFSQLPSPGTSDPSHVIPARSGRMTSWTGRAPAAVRQWECSPQIFFLILH